LARNSRSVAGVSLSIGRRGWSTPVGDRTNLSSRFSTARKSRKFIRSVSNDTLFGLIVNSVCSAPSKLSCQKQTGQFRFDPGGLSVRVANPQQRQGHLLIRGWVSSWVAVATRFSRSPSDKYSSSKLNNA